MPPKQKEELFSTLKARFEKNMTGHKEMEWSEVKATLEGNAEKLLSLNEMESIGGEHAFFEVKEDIFSYRYSCINKVGHVRN